MRRGILADALMQNRQAEEKFRFSRESNYKMALLTAELVRPDAAVLEIPESGEWTPERCMDLCGTLGRHLSGMPILVLCPEELPDACLRTVNAVKAGVIKDYVFYDTSTQYLLSKLDAL
jgi:hypothetical protein